MPDFHATPDGQGGFNISNDSSSRDGGIDDYSGDCLRDSYDTSSNSDEKKGIFNDILKIFIAPVIIFASGLIPYAIFGGWMNTLAASMSNVSVMTISGLVSLVIMVVVLTTWLLLKWYKKYLNSMVMLGILLGCVAAWLTWLYLLS